MVSPSLTSHAAPKGDLCTSHSTSECTVVFPFPPPSLPLKFVFPSVPTLEGDIPLPTFHSAPGCGIQPSPPPTLIMKTVLVSPSSLSLKVISQLPNSAPEGVITSHFTPEGGIPGNPLHLSHLFLRPGKVVFSLLPHLPFFSGRSGPHETFLHGRRHPPPPPITFLGLLVSTCQLCFSLPLSSTFFLRLPPLFSYLYVLYIALFSSCEKFVLALSFILFSFIPECCFFYTSFPFSFFLIFFLT